MKPRAPIHVLQNSTHTAELIHNALAPGLKKHIRDEVVFKDAIAGDAKEEVEKRCSPPGAVLPCGASKGEGSVPRVEGKVQEVSETLEGSLR